MNKKIFNSIIFDLDGTLVDSRGGIITTINSVAKKLGKKIFPSVKIKKQIGPPLQIIISKLFPSENVEFVERFATVFRQEYIHNMLSGVKLFPGIADLLSVLKSDGRQLFIATYKPLVFTEQIIAGLGLRHYFTDIKGPPQDSFNNDKSQLVRDIIVQHRLIPQNTVMVGDRKDDIIAAFDNNLNSIGVTYGYGSAEELVAAGAQEIFDSVRAIKEFLTEK